MSTFATPGTNMINVLDNIYFAENPYDSENYNEAKNKNLYIKQKKCKDRFNGYISFHTISYVYICEIILGQKRSTITHGPWNKQLFLHHVSVT